MCACVRVCVCVCASERVCAGAWRTRLKVPGVGTRGVVCDVCGTARLRGGGAGRRQRTVVRHAAMRGRFECKNEYVSLVFEYEFKTEFIVDHAPWSMLDAACTAHSNCQCHSSLLH